MCGGRIHRLRLQQGTIICSTAGSFHTSHRVMRFKKVRLVLTIGKWLRSKGGWLMRLTNPKVVIREVEVLVVCPEERRRWHELMAQHHSLGFRQFAGYGLRHVAV